MRIDWRRTLIVELALLAGCGLAVVTWMVVRQFAHTLLLLLCAAVVAFAIGPLVDRTEKRLGRRGLAAGVVYLGLVLAVAGGLALLTTPFVRQATALLTDLPLLPDAAQAQAPALDARLRELGLPVTVGDIEARAASLFVQSGDIFLGGTLAVLGGLTNLLLDLVLVLMMSLYLVLDGARLRVAFLRLVPLQRRSAVIFVEDTVVLIAGGYLRGQLLMALSIGVLAGVGALLFGLRYPVVIGVVAGVLELVPMFGPILGAVPALLLALLLPFPTVLWVGLYFLAIQQVESNVLAPRITGHAVGLHPLAALLALLAGFEAAGVFGGLIAVPVVGVGWVLAGALYRKVLRGAAPSPAPVERGWRVPAFVRGARPAVKPDEAVGLEGR